MPPDDDDAFADFSLIHALSHDRIAKAMYANANYYTTYPLYETPDHDHDWLLNHQAEHQSIFTLLGMTGLPDLATVDLTKPEEREDWLLLHMQIHQRINAALNIF